jgi:hypothetical protein
VLKTLTRIRHFFSPATGGYSASPILKHGRYAGGGNVTVPTSDLPLSTSLTAVSLPTAVTTAYQTESPCRTTAYYFGLRWSVATPASLDPAQPRRPLWRGCTMYYATRGRR